jgi:tRNA nucleotidyltransferase (CCA-adding enzyme)
VQGRHLIEMGLKPGGGFTPILKQAFEAQLEGEFADLEGGLAWTKKLLDKDRETPAS